MRREPQLPRAARAPRVSRGGPPHAPRPPPPLVPVPRPLPKVYVAALVESFKGHVAAAVPGLVSLMMGTGLSPALIETLATIARTLPV